MLTLSNARSSVVFTLLAKAGKFILTYLGNGFSFFSIAKVGPRHVPFPHTNNHNCKAVRPLPSLRISPLVY